MFNSFCHFDRAKRAEKSLLLLQRLGRIGAGGAEGLPQDGAEGDSEGRYCCDDVYPRYLRHLVHECLKIASRNPYRYRNPYNAGYESVCHVLKDVADAFAADSTSEHLADADFLLSFGRIICAHRDLSEGRQHDSHDHE